MKKVKPKKEKNQYKKINVLNCDYGENQLPFAKINKKLINDVNTQHGLVVGESRGGSNRGRSANGDHKGRRSK